jgi:uncharacterized protein YlxP (DUF503 family)
MIIGSCTVELYLPGVHSLKAKRSVLKGVLSRLRREFNVSAAEVDHQDVWHSAVIGLVTVSNDTAYAHGTLIRAVQWIEQNRLDVDLVNYQIEVF